MWDCPACGSRDTWRGSAMLRMPLRCNNCTWHYLNKHPCDVCGAPSVSTMGSSDGRGNNIRRYRCWSHPFTNFDRDAVLRPVFVVLEGMINDLDGAE